MSTRSTPARQNGGPSTAPLLSPTGSTTAYNTVPLPRPKSRSSLGFMSQGGPVKRPGEGTRTTSRKVSASSVAGSSVFARQASSTSVSASGASTPRRKVRTKANGGPSEKLSEEDWAELDADEVFRRLGVTEVKKVEAQMRTDASNKQTELRSMVGCAIHVGDGPRSSD